MLDHYFYILSDSSNQKNASQIFRKYILSLKLDVFKKYLTYNIVITSLLQTQHFPVQ